jgi:hypothetical protein
MTSGGCWVAAHLAALRRTGVGRLEVRDAVTADALDALEAERQALLSPPTACSPLARGTPGRGRRGPFLSDLRRRIDGADAVAVRVWHTA